MCLLADVFVVNQCFTDGCAFLNVTGSITVHVVCWLFCHAQADTLQGVVLGHISMELVVNLCSTAKLRITSVVSINAIVIGCMLMCLRGGIMVH